MANELAKSCKELSYRLRLPSADFDLASFSASLGGKKKTSSSWQTATLRARTERSFHCHLNWRVEKGKPENVQVQGEFHRWKSETKVQVEEPTADEVFEWVSRYTSLKSQKIHVHADFVLSREQWRANILPLPWELPFGNDAPTVNGVEFSVRTNPEGILGGFVRAGDKFVELTLYADRNVAFNDFNIERDIKAFVSVARTIVGEI